MSSNVTRRTFTMAGLATTAALPFANTRAWADIWPSKPIKIVDIMPAGAFTDQLARAYGDYLSQKLRQPVVVENKPGGTGLVAARIVKSSPADGYTLLFAIGTTMMMNRVLYKRLPYDPDNDFVPISGMSPGSLVFVAHASTGATNLAEFIEYARRNKTNIATFGAGSSSHMVVAELNRHFGLDMQPVHYAGPAMWRDFNAGMIQAAQAPYYLTLSTLQTRTGQAIATWPNRTKKLPDVPTFAEQGVVSELFGLRGYVGLFGPRGISPEIVERLSALMVEAGKSERVQKLLDAMAIDEAAYGHKELKELHERETPLWIGFVKQLEIEPQ